MSKQVLHTKFGTAKVMDGRYYKITSSKEGNQNKYLHRLLWEDFYGCEIPKGYHIHHKNGDRLDNCILNLQLINGIEHVSMHSKGENNGMYGRTHTPEVKDKLRKLRTGEKKPDEINMKQSATLSTTGYFRVTKHKNKQYSQGFFWSYQYYDEDKKRKAIVGKTIENVKKKVLAKGLPWKKFD